MKSGCAVLVTLDGRGRRARVAWRGSADGSHSNYLEVIGHASRGRDDSSAHPTGGFEGHGCAALPHTLVGGATRRTSSRGGRQARTGARRSRPSRARIARQASLAELAEATDLSLRTVQRLEHLETNNPPIGYRANLSLALDDLIEDEPADLVVFDVAASEPPPPGWPEMPSAPGVSPSSPRCASADGSSDRVP